MTNNELIKKINELFASRVLCELDIMVLEYIRDFAIGQRGMDETDMMDLDLMLSLTQEQIMADIYDSMDRVQDLITKKNKHD